MSVSSVQLPTERALQKFLQDSGDINPTYRILCAHDMEALPREGNFVAITTGPGNSEELIDNATSRVEFRVATQVADADIRAEKTAELQAIVGAIQNLFCWQNFDDALPALNAQQTEAGGITIGVSGWEEIGAPMDTQTDAQIISTLPYDFDVFISDAESESES